MITLELLFKIGYNFQVSKTEFAKAKFLYIKNTIDFIYHYFTKFAFNMVMPESEGVES